MITLLGVFVLVAGCLNLDDKSQDEPEAEVNALREHVQEVVREQLKPEENNLPDNATQERIIETMRERRGNISLENGTAWRDMGGSVFEGRNLTDEEKQKLIEEFMNKDNKSQGMRGSHERPEGMPGPMSDKIMKEE
ncbi:MAG: hypothetical protein V1921_05530 [Candidatus Altiarchaeota archaeon]